MNFSKPNEDWRPIGNADAFPFARKPQNERRIYAAPMQPVTIIGRQKQGTNPWGRARIMALSAEGCRMHHMGRIDPYKPVQIEIPGLAPMFAEVGQCVGNVTECYFRTPLYVAVFENILQRFGQ